MFHLGYLWYTGIGLGAGHFLTVMGRVAILGKPRRFSNRSDSLQIGQEVIASHCLGSNISENVNLKVNLHCFKLSSPCSISFNLSNTGEILCG